MLATADDSGVRPADNERLERYSDKLYEDLVTVDEACKVLKVNRATVFRLMSRGELPRVKWFGRTQIPVEDLMTYKAAQIEKARFEAERIARKTARPRRASK